jgi:hypothetical protein
LRESIVVSCCTRGLSEVITEDNMIIEHKSDRGIGRNVNHGYKGDDESDFSVYIDEQENSVSEANIESQNRYQKVLKNP